MEGGDGDGGGGGGGGRSRAAAATAARGEGGKLIVGVSSGVAVVGCFGIGTGIIGAVVVPLTGCGSDTEPLDGKELKN